MFHIRHLSIYISVFSSAEHRLVFDINDFDETYPGPWEWDVERLAASVEICGRYRGFSEEKRRNAVYRALESYHDAMARFSSMGTIDLTTVTSEDLTWLSGVCGWTLARAHARTGDRHAIARYLGKSRKFEEAVTEFASHYADQKEEDYRTYVKYYKEQQEKRGESR